jgi:hypothetical protein
MTQAQPKQNPPFINLPINRGTRPDWQTRINYPKLFNWFVGGSGYVYTDPGLKRLAPDAPDQNARAIHYSSYKGGRYFTVTKRTILEISLDGNSYRKIATIRNSGLPVQIDENDQHQVIFVDGRNAYVYAQQANPPTFTTLSTTEGFELTNPISVVVLNNIGIVLDGTENKWVISSANNLLNWPALNFVAQLDSGLTKGVGLEVLDNNLFIFGTTGIERWTPNTGNSIYSFPFDKDVNYRQSFGAIATNAIVSGVGVGSNYNVIYFVSSKGVPMSLSRQGLQELASEDFKTGLAKIFTSYPNARKLDTAFYTYKGNYVFTMTFVDSNICWRYCVNSGTYSTGDDLIISSVNAVPVVATPEGIFTLELTPQNRKRRTWIGDTIRLYKGQQPTRNTMNGFDVQMLQGLLHNSEDELELSFSLDGQQTWTNTVNRPIGATGQRNAQTTWRFNIAAKEFTPRVEYFGDLDLTIREINATFR